MCGITGYVLAAGNDMGLADALDRSVSMLHHRGPDDRGVWFGVGLGHTRLSILDLSALGHLPMVSADGRDVIVFNGEIYNFWSIRGELEKLGHAFQGSGDSEVVLAALREWGREAVHRFSGMFAIVPRDLVDRPKRGFSVPLASWLRTDLAPLVSRYLSPDRVRSAGILDSATVAGVVNRFQQGCVVETNRLWLLLAFELWRERWEM
jgi:asparagine synthetase B (glutamine-hydrolysing)